MRVRAGASILIVAFGLASCRRSLAPEAAMSTLGITAADNSGVSLASDGHRVVAAWAASQEDRTDIYAATSQDDGASFGPAVRVNDVDGDARVSGEQPPRVAVGREIVVVWASRVGQASRIRMARSTDAGRTFVPAVTLHDESLTGARGWQSVTIDAAGLVHALWLDGRNATPAAAGEHHHDMSAMGGGPNGVKKAAVETASPRQDIVHATWAPNAPPVESQVASNVCFCCKTSIAVGPDHALYAAWRHIYANSMRDIAIARSTDDGRTFGPATRVSTDNWQLSGCPDDGPAMVIDAANVIHVVWPTLVPGATATKGVFYTFSSDNGQSFSPRIRLDDPSATGAGHPTIAIDGRDLIVGWDNLSPMKQRRVRLRRISSSGWGPAWSPDAAPSIFGSEGPASYPSIAVAGGKVIVAWTEESGDHPAIHVRRFGG